MLNTKQVKKENVRSRFLTGKKLIVLSIVLLTTLSATFLNKYPGQVTKENTEAVAETSLVIKLKQFDAKEYRATYERKKKARQMLIDALKND